MLKQKITQILVIIRDFEVPPVGAPIQNFKILFWDLAINIIMLIRVESTTFSDVWDVHYEAFF